MYLLDVSPTQQLHQLLSLVAEWHLSPTKQLFRAHILVLFCGLLKFFTWCIKDWMCSILYIKVRHLEHFLDVWTQHGGSVKKGSFSPCRNTSAPSWTCTLRSLGFPYDAMACWRARFWCPSTCTIPHNNMSRHFCCSSHPTWAHSSMLLFWN